MKNQDQALRDVLHAIVKDLQNTSACLSYISAELGKLVSASVAEQRDAIALAHEVYKETYDKLHSQIDALEITSK